MASEETASVEEVRSRIRAAAETGATVLDLSDCGLTSLPAEIRLLTSLTALDLRRNRLSVLPVEIGSLTSLTMLFLNSNGLSVLPVEIGSLTSLTSLYLGGNGLSVLPVEIGSLTSLTTLDLWDNQLSMLPAEIGSLTSLTTLDLGHNGLSVLPAEIGSLTSLTTLDLGHNGLSVLPAEIGSLTSLTTLNLAHNGLGVLPVEIGSLTSLTTLKLTGNQLSMLPAEIGSLASLTTLNLAHNGLSVLPVEIGSLTSLTTLNLEGNPLTDPLPVLVESGGADVLAYLRSLRDGESQYTAKLLLVGEGNVGKSSLVAALRGDAFIEQRATTHGIEQGLLTLPHPTEGVEMSLNTWDFGGQEVYRITHQFFFSPSALYLLVWRPREGQEENAIDGWCRRIRLRVGGEAKILIVATHAAERRPELDYPQLQRRFGDVLAGQFAVDNSDGRGIPELLAEIAGHAAALPQMGERLSASWLAARDDLLARAASDPQIPYADFCTICDCHGLDDDETGALARLLHNVGHVIYYGDDDGLRDVMVLQPEWLTKAIGQVLEDTLTREDAGVLDHRRLGEIWGAAGGLAYPDEYHPYFVRLMEKFDVSYRIPDEQASLVGQLVPVERPSLPWDDGPAAGGARTLSLTCRLTEPAEGLVAWLTVRHHRFSTGRHWRRGVFLEHELYGAEALLELIDDMHLRLTVRGPSPDTFFSILRDGVEHLIRQRWEGLGYELLVPCPGTLDGEPCVESFRFENLVRYRERGRRTIECHTCFSTPTVNELLTGFALPDVSLRDELAQIREQIELVHGGVTAVKTIASQSADGVRRILRAISEEVIDCPRLFVLVPVDRRFQVPHLSKQRLRLTLWCEHPDHEHPCADASYELAYSAPLIRALGPYARVVVRALALLVPIVGAAAGVGLSEEGYKSVKEEIELTKALIEALPEPSEDAEPRLKEGEGLSYGEGAGLRALRAALRDLDPSSAFGGMRRRQTSAGDFVWICREHYREYDPGLPILP